MGGNEPFEDAIPAASVRVQDDAARPVVHVLQVDDLPVPTRLPALGASHIDDEALGAHGFRLSLSPFDDGDGLVQGGVQVQGLEVAEVGNAVGVGMDQVGAPVKGGVNSGDDERRGGDASAHPHAGPDALSERRLARPEAAGEHDEVAGAQQPSQVRAKVAGLVGAARANLKRGGGSVSHGGSSRAVPPRLRCARTCGGCGRRGE